MKNKISMLGIFLMLFASCEKFLDVNENENAIVEDAVTLRLLLPSVQAGLGQVVGNNLQIVGGLYSQYWTQSNAASQFKTLEQYLPDGTDFDRPWRTCYTDGLKDAKIMEEKALASGDSVYVGISKILQAYTYQLLTDNFGDIPFSEAIDQTILNPKYDAQKDVYNGIFKLLNEGRQLVFNADQKDPEIIGKVPAEDDLLFGGALYLWIEFANTIQLKASLRISKQDEVLAKAQIDLSQENGYGYFTAGENALINYSGAGGNSNPLNSFIIGTGNTENLIASKTTFDYFEGNADARLSYLYLPGIALAQGDFGAPVGPTYAFPSDYTGANNGNRPGSTANQAPVRLMSDYESSFLQAEAIARGWLTGDDAALYSEGISQSFRSVLTYNLLPADFIYPEDILKTTDSTYQVLPAIAYPSDPEAKIERIITEKWAAMCGTQGIEAWTEWRRTGYPNFFVVSANSLIGNNFPNRLLYPSSEVTRNASFPGQVNITDKVWWDIN
jgi:Starch-binding associating with outer membrane